MNGMDTNFLALPTGHNFTLFIMFPYPVSFSKEIWGGGGLSEKD